MERTQHWLKYVYPPLTLDFITYIDTHVTSPLSVSEIDQALNVTEHRLSAEVNHYLEMTIPTYIIRRRVEEAALLLLQIEKPIKIIVSHF